MATRAGARARGRAGAPVEARAGTRPCAGGASPGQRRAAAGPEGSRGETRRALLVGGLSSAVARASRSENGFEQTEVELVVPGLDPAHDGLRVAQLSDIHVGIMTPEARVRGAVASVNALKPDLVALTGDFVTYSKRPVPLTGKLLAGLEPPSPFATPAPRT